MTPERLGQHFLAGAGWRERIARAVLGCSTIAAAENPHPAHGGAPGCVWIEIGAGHGEMTALLAPEVDRLIAIELDQKLLPRLRENTASFSNVTIVPGDVLSSDLPKLAGYLPYRVYGNIPYYITSPIVHHVFENAAQLEAAFLVMQWEVAERLAAQPGSRDYGYFSAFTQFYARSSVLLRIPPGAFRPRPKVGSALVSLRPPGERARLAAPATQDERGFFQFLKTCFAHKRKTLKNNLQPLAGARAEMILRACGIPPNARSEEITLEQFARLFAALREA